MMSFLIFPFFFVSSNIATREIDRFFALKGSALSYQLDFSAAALLKIHQNYPAHKFHNKNSS
jgi:hypothetical protein